MFYRYNIKCIKWKEFTKIRLKYALEILQYTQANLESIPAASRCLGQLLTGIKLRVEREKLLHN